MGAPIGNRFWMLGPQDGRPRSFASPEELWNKALEYFEWCNENPINTLEYHGKDAIQCTVPKMRAFTWTGLELFLGVNSLEEYKTTYKEFSEIITRIGKIIYTQKLEGAAAGVLNANIIARDLGLTDKKEVFADVKQNLSEGQLKEIAERLR